MENLGLPIVYGNLYSLHADNTLGVSHFNL